MLFRSGFFPTDRSNIYALEADDLYLTGTSEVALASFHMGEILDELPLYYAAFSPCFRRESGAAGKDTRGAFRVHQFNKVELFVYCRPAESRDEHDRILAIEEELVQALGLPYRVVNVAAGDLGAPAAKKYDIEAWFPSQQRYREITSTSNTTDFQARRLGIRYRADEKFGAVQWIESGFGWVVSGPMDKPRLKSIASAAYDQLENRPAPGRSSANQLISRRGS